MSVPLQRLVYEAIHTWAIVEGSMAFNRGFRPVDQRLEFETVFGSDRSQLQLYAELMKLLPWSERELKELSILDAPAGCGAGLLYLKRRFAPKDLAGVDTSFVACLRSRWMNVKVAHGTLSNLPFASRQFDCVLCIEGFNYVPHLDYLGEVRRVVKEGGRILIADRFHRDVDVAALFRQLGGEAGFELEAIRDATEGVRQSLVERNENRRESLPLRLPVVRNYLKEMLCLPDSDQFRDWITGTFVYKFVMLRQTPPT